MRFVFDPALGRSRWRGARRLVSEEDVALILLAALMFANNLGGLNETVGTYD